MTPFAAVRASADEAGAPLFGDEVIHRPDVVMDRAFSLAAPPEVVWPWFAQLGKNRAGWYLPRRVERFVPRRRRGLRAIDPNQQHLQIGDVIDDWGGRHATFEVALFAPPRTIVYTSTRGRVRLSWAIVLRPEGDGTRVQLRLRLAPVRRIWLAKSVGDAVDALSVAGLAAGLRERLPPPLA